MECHLESIKTVLHYELESNNVNEEIMYLKKDIIPYYVKFVTEGVK